MIIAASAEQLVLADAKVLALQQRPELRQMLYAQNAAGKLRKMNQPVFALQFLPPEKPDIRGTTIQI
ncbi:MAG: hypothetical protein R3C26_03205 [Calditrichia bacterium]